MIVDPRQRCSVTPDGTILVNTDRVDPRLFGENTRRDFIHSGIRVGGMGLAAMFGLAPVNVRAEKQTNGGGLAPKNPHFTGKAKAIIQIIAEGGPSTVDTWDPKPELNRNDGKKIPGYPGVALGSPFQFRKMGQAGIEVSEVFPELGKLVDEMAVIRSLYTDIPDHAIAAKMLTTGATQTSRPSLGSWVTYGLGSANPNLPGFITLGGNATYRQAAFLPGLYQGCNVNFSESLPLTEVLANITSQVSTPERQRLQIDFAKELNQMDAIALQRDIQMETRIQAFEIAFTMQKAAIEAFDISQEPKPVHEMYRGAPGKGNAAQKGARMDGNMGAKLLVARRLVERGVRFVQVTQTGWDHHKDIGKTLQASAEGLDAPAAALLKDLKQRGLLDSTLVVWGGEIGRQPTIVGAVGTPGRDHNGNAICAWMAGGGVKGGTVYGTTDEFGGRAVENKMHIHDLHATMLALMGLDHTKLTYNYNGRDFRLTDNEGSVVKELIA